jgi:hypothetical protein
MCVGIDLCSKKNCLEQERCVHGIWPTHTEFIPRGNKRTKKKRQAEKKQNMDLRFKIYGPEVIGNVDVRQFSCKKHTKRCPSDKACEMLGQCMYSHPAVVSSKSFKKELNKAKCINEISNAFVNRLAKVKKKPKT